MGFKCRNPCQVAPEEQMMSEEYYHLPGLKTKKTKLLRLIWKPTSKEFGGRMETFAMVEVQCEVSTAC